MRQGQGALVVRPQDADGKESPAVTQEPTAAPRSVDLSKANDALSGLLGGKGGPAGRK